ncbi:MAG: MBL fold metallo-hydrolase [Sulfolobales archaeon]|nr:MBL fold metallo-hydrolase [Sulfolobales archaeon]
MARSGVYVLKFVVGFLDTNMYLVFDRESRDAVLVDVGGDPSEAISWIQKLGLKLRAALATHGHYDHVAGIPQLGIPRLPTYMHRSDLDVVRLSAEWYSNYARTRAVVPEFSHFLEGDVELKIGTVELAVLHTPGHTPGSVSIYVPSAGILLTGDTLFAGTVGRTDLPGGSEEGLRRSIRKIYERVPLDAVVYPGHGPQTTLGRELRANPFFEDSLGYSPLR